MRKYDNYCSHLNVLSGASRQDLENEFILSGIIDKFFIQFELAWKLLKELLKYEGSMVAATGSPRAIIKEAYMVFDFLEEGIWLEMLENRNDLTHIYDGARAKNLAEIIINEYVPEFQKMKRAIDDRYKDQLEKL